MANKKDYLLLFVLSFSVIFVVGIFFNDIPTSTIKFAGLLGKSLGAFLIAALFMKFKGLNAGIVALAIVIFLSVFGQINQ